MEITWIVLNVLFSLGVTLGVGSSTFALAFFIAAKRDGVVDGSERAFMGIVFFVLRIGMALIGIGLIGAYFMDIVPTQAYLMQWTMFAVITLNAILMTLHKMPMRFGPVIAGSSWYTLFVVSEVPLYTLTYPMLLIGYVAFMVLFFFVLEALKKLFAPAPAPAPTV